ncbi:substrate-binding domain-containing protein [Ruminococcus sp.]|uniref:substrate-binding domain-containing protein n=1 Tax=Ruminococcus sp. TaxID=41978 RepID=UPI003AB3C4D0
MIGNIKIIAVCMCKVYDERNYRIIRALNNFAVENDYRLLVYHTCSDLYWKTLSEKGEQSVFDLIDYNITDAVVTFEEGVYAENIMTKIRMDAAEYGKPVISVGVEHDDCISIKFDYAKGFEQVVRHVIEQHGVRDIGFIAGRKDEENSEERIAVFRKLLEEYDIPFRNDVFYYGDYWSAPTLKAVDDMIEENKVPRAIICANDMMAIAAGAEFQRRGYKIPEDIIITGFDGLEEARYCTPMLTTSGCSYDDTAKTIINTISKALAGEKTEKVYTVDYDLSVENSCGCKPSVEQINTGEHIRMLRDRMNCYQDEERVLYELAVNVMNCETPKTLAALLKEYAFGDMAVVVNGDFFDERKDPRVSNREPLFSDKMILLRSRAVEDRDVPQPFDRTNIIPDIENIMDYKVPLIFSALAYIGIPLGYACFYFPVRLNEYFKIPLYVNSLNTALGSFRSVTYQKYMTKHIEEMYRHDMLTGLYNRTGFYNALETLPRRNDQLALVVSVDVDGLKHKR